mgnify:CR=1 FL=1
MYKRQGVLDQGYWPDGLLTAPSDEALVHDITAMKESGFTMLRKHIKIESARWYYHCDRLGMLVWQDAVSGGGEYNAWVTNRKPTLMRATWNKYRDDTAKHFAALGADDSTYRRDWSRTCDAMVHMLAGHPSIVTWVLFNEGWGQFDARKATEALRALDPSRPVDEASGWFDRGGGDVHSIHNYFYPLRIRPNVRTVALSEYGGIAWPMPGHEPPRRAYGYGTAKSRAELTARWKKLQLETVLPQLKKGLSALVYTQVSDVEDEVNGLFTYDRTAIKPDAAAVRAVNEALEAEFERAVKA